MSPTRGANFWGPRESIFQVRHGEVQLLLGKGLLLIMEGVESRTRGPKRHVFSSTLLVEAFVRWATGKRLSNRLLKLSPITC